MRAATVTAILWTLLTAASAAQTRQPADREIVHLKGDLYRVRDGAQHTVFLVTANGIILADPLQRSTAAWLEEEFENRFPTKLVRFVVISTDHYLRVEGAALFNETALIVGQSKISDAVQKARQDLPGSLAVLDQNASHTLEPIELKGHPEAAALLARDRDGDGVLRPSELYGSVTNVERTFDTSDSIGTGATVMAPAASAPELSVLWFPKERIVFAAAVPGLLARPARLDRGNASAALAWVRAIGALDFEAVITGDGQTISRAEVESLRQYLDALFTTVAEGYAAGRSIEELQTTVTHDAFRTAPFYPGRRAQISELFGGVRILTGEIYGFASGRYVMLDTLYRAGYSVSRDVVVPVGTVGARISGRTFGLAGEFASGPQEMIERRSAFYDERIAVRDSRVSALFRVTGNPSGVSFAALAGLSGTVTDARGEYIARATGGALGGRHPLASRHKRYGVTGGTDATVRLSPNVGMLITVRVTRALSDRASVTPARDLDVQAGFGLSIRTHRKFRDPN